MIMENKKSKLCFDMKIARKLLKMNGEIKFCPYCGKGIEENCECHKNFVVDIKPYRNDDGVVDKDERKAFSLFDLAFTYTEDDKLKNLRYAIGKSIAKHKTPHFEDICMAFLEHKDVSTKGTGLDMYASNHYSEAKQIVEKIAESEEKANNPLKKKAQLILQKSSH